MLLLLFSQAGLFIDKGVKTTNASAADPREYLCLDNNARSGLFNGQALKRNLAGAVRAHPIIQEKSVHIKK